MATWFRQRQWTHNIHIIYLKKNRTSVARRQVALLIGRVPIINALFGLCRFSCVFRMHKIAQTNFLCDYNFLTHKNIKTQFNTNNLVRQDHLILKFELQNLYSLVRYKFSKIAENRLFPKSRFSTDNNSKTIRAIKKLREIFKRRISLAIRIRFSICSNSFR
jgi:outer membrane protein assembly factor BamE (lipoprotein component of BamABCDE complex)